MPDNFYESASEPSEKDLPKMPKPQKENMGELKIEFEKWKEEANKRFKDAGSRERVEDPTWYKVMIVFLLLVIIGGIALFGWGVMNDKFKSNTDITQTVTPQVNVTSNNANTVNNAFDNQFDNRATINATIVINNLNVQCNSS